MIKKCGEEFCVYDKSGTKLLGKHKTEQGAEDQLKAIEASKHFNSIHGVEIFKAGLHNGDKYTEADIQEIVDNTNQLDFLPAIKVGHTSGSDLPAYGYVENIRKIADTIVGDFTNLTDDVFASIKQKRFGRVSAEILFGLKRDGKLFKKSLGAVALLGQAIPGVANLKPLYKMNFSQDVESTLYFESDFMGASYSDGDGQRNSQGDNYVSEETLKKFQEQVDALNKQLEAVAPLKAQFDAIKSENEKLSKQLFDQKITDKTKQLPPSIKGLFVALYNLTDTSVKTYSLEVDGKKQDVGMEAAIDTLAEQLTKKFASLLVEQGQQGDDKSSQYGDVYDEVDVKAKEYMSKNKSVVYADAMKAVLQADADLKQRYFKGGE